MKIIILPQNWTTSISYRNVFTRKNKTYQAAKHQRESENHFKYGLTHIEKASLNTHYQDDIIIFVFWSCT